MSHNNNGNHEYPPPNTNRLNPFYIEELPEYRDDPELEEDGYCEPGYTDEYLEEYHDNDRPPPRRRFRGGAPRSKKRRRSPASMCGMAFCFGFVLAALFLLSSNHSQNAANKKKGSDNQSAAPENLPPPPTEDSEPNYSPTGSSKDLANPSVSPSVSPSSSPTPFPSSSSPPVEGTSAKSSNSSSPGPSSSPPIPLSNASERAREIVLIGERHSGVEWWRDQLQRCFSELNVTTRLSRDAEWFQQAPDDENDSERTGIVLVVAALNVYDWVQEMRLRPIHMPAHAASLVGETAEPMPWMDFVQQVWSTNRSSTDTPNQTTCQLGFEYNQVVACEEYSGTGDAALLNPIYELNEGGDPFDNILKLRGAKLRHFVQEVPTMWSYHVLRVSGEPLRPIILSYEKNPREQFTAVAEAIMTNATCANETPPALSNRDGMTDEYFDYLRKNVDWEAESLVGYSQSQDFKTGDDSGT